MKERIERFKEIMEEINQLIEEAYDITLKLDNSMISKRAYAYWYSQISGTVDGTGSMVTMQSTLDELHTKCDGGKYSEYAEELIGLVGPQEDYESYVIDFAKSCGLDDNETELLYEAVCNLQGE